jgi:hypothetical protein
VWTGPTPPKGAPRRALWGALMTGTQEPQPGRHRAAKTAVFVGGMLVVLVVFIVLSHVEGPPRMPSGGVHAGLKTDAACLSCHGWTDRSLPGAAPVVKPLGPKHPPPRPKKRRPADAPVQFECLKCHAP